MKKILIIFNKFFKRIEEDHINEYAAECAFFTILSFVPFIMFFISLIQFTNIDRETIYFWIKEIIPSTMYGMIAGIIDEVYSKSVGTISIAVIFALWSASRGFYYLSKGLRKIYKSPKQKISFVIRIEGIIYTLVFIISIIAFLILMVFGNRIHMILSQKFHSIGIITSSILKIRSFILILGIFFILLCIYRFIPKNNLKIKDQIYGAIFSSITCFLASWFFSIYVDLFQGFSNIYGSLTSIIFVMMWVYVCMYIILIGAEINVIISNIKLKK